jgi:hypothetical protein
MALLNSGSPVTKQPAETIPIDIDYRTVINGRLVESMTCTPTLPGGITSPGQAISGGWVQIYIAGGTTATAYKLVLLVTITIAGLATVLQDEIDIYVLEIANS